MHPFIGLLVNSPTDSLNDSFVHPLCHMYSLILSNANNETKQNNERGTQARTHVSDVDLMHGIIVRSVAHLISNNIKAYRPELSRF